MTNSNYWTRSHLAFVAKNITTSAWSNIFAYMINLTPSSNRDELVRYADNLIATAFSYDEDFDWDLHGLQTIESPQLLNIIREKTLSTWQKEELKERSFSSIYMPNWSLGWNCNLVEDPCKAREILGLSNSDNLVEKLLMHIKEFIDERDKDNRPNNKVADLHQKSSKERTLVCMVAPYIDCLWLPAILIAIEDILRDNKIIIEFKFIEHSEIQSHIGNIKYIDIGIATKNQLTVNNKKINSYEFSEFYFKPLKINAMIETEAYYKARDKKSQKKETFDLIPFTGDLYKQRIVGDDPNQKLRFDVVNDIEKWENDKITRFSDESFFHLFLANKMLYPHYAITPTSDGFVWGIDLGLIKPPSQKSETLPFLVHPVSCSTEQKIAEDPTLGLIVRTVRGRMHAENFLVFLRTTVKDHFEKCAGESLKLAWAGEIGFPYTSSQSTTKSDQQEFFKNANAWHPTTTALVELLMTPIYRSKPDYYGNLNRMQPSAFLHNLAFFEKYFDYVPIWQQQLNILLTTDKTKPGNDSTKVSDQSVAS